MALEGGSHGKGRCAGVGKGFFYNLRSPKLTKKILMSNLILTLIFLIYLLFILFYVETPKGTGDANMGMVIYFYLFIAYVALSLLLTIIVTFNGGFNWISNSMFWRNIGVGALWLGMVGGVLICMSMKASFGIGNKSTGLMRLLAFMFYYGGVWLPLLMLVSYLSMVNPDWRLAISPNLYKTFILLSSTIGLVTFVARAPISNLIKANTDEHNFNITLKEIDKAKTLEEQFWLTTKITDERLLAIVFTRIKNQQNLEDEIIKILMQNNQFIFSNIYDYIYNNPVEHPERLIEPINLNLTKIDMQIRGSTLAPWVGVEGFDHVKIQPILRVMYKYFGEKREPFRANMLTIKQTLETPKARNKGNKDAAEFMAILNKYKLEVQNWLDGH